MIDFIAGILGALIRLIYDIVGQNYGLSIIHCCFYSQLLAICNVVPHSLMFILKTLIKFQ